MNNHTLVNIFKVRKKLNRDQNKMVSNFFKHVSFKAAKNTEHRKEFKTINVKKIFLEQSQRINEQFILKFKETP